MSGTRSYVMTETSFEKELNVAKHSLLESMVRENFLSKEKAEEYAEKYIIVLRPKNFFRRFWKELTVEEKDDIHYFVVKRV